MIEQVRLDFGPHFGATLEEVIERDMGWIFSVFPTPAFKNFLRRHRLGMEIGVRLPCECRFAFYYPDDQNRTIQ